MVLRVVDRVGPAAPRAWRLPSRGKTIEVVAKTVERLPESFDGPLAALAGTISYVSSSRERRATVRENQRIPYEWAHRHAWGHKWRVEILVVRSHVAYARYFIGLFRTRGRSTSDIAGRVTTENSAEFLSRVISGKPVVLVLPHLGDWELGGAWMSSVGPGISTIVEDLSDESMTKWFLDTRVGLGMRVELVSPRSVAWLLRELRHGRAVALAVDRDITGNGVDAELFGYHVSIARSPAFLAERSHAPVIPVAAYQEPHGRVRIKFWPSIVASEDGERDARVEALSQDIARVFEEMIAYAPEQWHVFQPYFRGVVARPR